ncbi:MAG TPA: putative baseplate assembly protein, partial [Polyangiaceae bacterium]
NANESARQSFRPFGKASSTQDIFYLVFSLNLAPPWPNGKFQLRVNLAGSKDVGDPPEPEFDIGAPKRIQWGFSSGTSESFDGTKSLVFTDVEPSQDTTQAFTRSGYLEFDFQADQTVAFTFSNDDALVPEFFKGFFVLQARILRSDAFQGQPIPSLGSVRLNTVPATAVRTIRDELLGSSSGLAFQRFRLANAPVVPGSTSIAVDESANSGSTEEPWSETNDLFAHGPNDRVYQLFPATGEILFGNGVFGKIPPPDDGGASSVHITAKRYQFGGGLAGNTGAQTLKNVVPINSIDAQFEATNVLQAAGGADEEPTEQGLARAPAVVRSRFRAVTTEDFEALARETPEVRVDRSFALASTRPGVTIGSSPGSVTVLLVPHVRFEDSVTEPIALQPHVAAAVLRYLDQRRLITTEVFTAAPRYRRITVRALLVAEPGASTNDARNAALGELNRYFHALVGGADGTGWPFGGTIFFSRVFERLLGVTGVARAVTVALSLDGSDFVECQDLTIGRGDLLVNGVHTVVVQGG